MSNKLHLILADLEKAILSFEKALAADLSKYNTDEIDCIKNGHLQKFEFTVELLWKTIKVYFKVKFEYDVNFAIKNIKEFFRQGLIDEETYNILYDAIKSRNLLSHVYKLEMFETLHPQLFYYLPAIKKTYEAIRLHTL